MNDPFRTVVQPDTSINWLTRALCRLYPDDVDLWFPSYRSGQTAASFRAKVEAEPKRVCGNCPVQAECREYGKNDQYGIFGGVSESERFPKPQRKFSSKVSA